MWIQVRSIDGKKTVRVDDLSKLTKIEDLRKKLIEPFEAETDSQKLFFRGKILVDGHSLFDYDVGLNDLVQIMVRKPIIETNNNVADGDELESSDKENQKPETPEKANSDIEDEEVGDIEGNIYKVGDIVDARDLSNGAWFEAKITKVTKDNSESATKAESDDITDTNKRDESDGFLYHVQYEGYEEVEQLKLKNVRPRCKNVIKFPNIEIGQNVMANYNCEDPTERGFWYDCLITGKKENKSKELLATVYAGVDLTPLEDCKLVFPNEVFSIESAGSQINEKDIDLNDATSTPTMRKNKIECEKCRDNPRVKCKECACSVCGGKQEPEKQILCDECNKAYHLFCMNPPLTKVPEEDEWYCANCKNDETEVVRAGEKLKQSKKKSKMASATSKSSRDWGKGMACVGRTSQCTIVPPNHFGPIPGIEVGMMWKFRVQVSEAGVHRPHVAGIHGREDEGSYSIVLSGGYEDDHDGGDEFTYTGSGGRDLSGNKRTAEQSCDQLLTRMNKALAKNCNASINVKDGAEAKDWKGGKPVRVVRNCKGRKHSKYAPEEGNRYDGIYKIVKYWPETGKSGFIVWRYLLRRDDQNPAPWTSAGKKKIKSLGLEMKYPDGYLETLKEKEKDKEENQGKGKKRKQSVESPTSTPKKTKISAYTLPADLQKLVKEDDKNKKIWDEALISSEEGKAKFLQSVEDLFTCICCQEIVFKPVSLDCSHNVCKSCLSRSFKAQVYSCPACRHDLGEKYPMEVNAPLSKVLCSLYPGYEAGR
ncbi:E3 ubiquitin-protein ligase UHRF1-like [Patella vulgata]|uniref:E3 ubiquitin-protein ligase UHRF1-like n=1 Tax=Patella vulgata TaxID=6465 RepID=UPI0024A8DB8E|nr:E3 ubiquitin-protein ligase UHRF1-like [Patella vulgata]